jgi:hypothetical protein
MQDHTPGVTRLGITSGQFASPMRRLAYRGAV